MKWKLIVVLLAGTVLYAACRKTDRVAEGSPPVNVEEKFFKGHASNDPLVQSLTKKMQRENQQRPFIETIIDRIGYPQWDKSMIVSKQDIPGSDRNSTGDSVDIVYIPFVRNSENYVNASLLFKVSPSDTAYQYLLDWEYESYGFDSASQDWNARDVFHLFANFDRNVFGRTAFEMTDDRIFGSTNTGEARLVKLRPQANTGARQNILVYTTVCDNVDHCYAPPGETPCANLVCTMQCPQYIYTTVECTTSWVEDGWVPASGGTTGTGGGTGGGSTGGGGGGYPPPVCPGVAARNGVVQGCGPGWVPPGGGGPPGPNANQNIIDSLQGYPCAQGIVGMLPSINDSARKILQNVFGVNDSINIIFKADSTVLLPSQNGGTSGPMTIINGKFKAKVLINVNVLKYSSKEFIAKTLYHEAIHAYLKYQWARYNSGLIDSVTFKAMFPKIWAYKTNQPMAQHIQMAGSYVDDIMSVVKGFNPNIRDSVNRAISWSGLWETEAWKQLGSDTFQLNRLRIIARGDTSAGSLQAMINIGLKKCN